MEEECLDAFESGKKEQALKLLPKLSNPETVRVSCTYMLLFCTGMCKMKISDWTLLHQAAWYGWEDVCKLLVEKYNCDPTAVDDHGTRPLHVACRSGSETSVKYLITLPSVLRRINDNDTNGRTPLHWACLGSHHSVIEILLETNAVKMTEEDEDGRTTLKVMSNYTYGVLNKFTNKIDWSTQLPVKSFFSVFLVGNSGAGKSTLAAAMLELTMSPTQHGRISNVKELTAGIVPTQCQG